MLNGVAAFSGLSRLKRRVTSRRAAPASAAVAGCDLEDFLKVARLSFVKLQAAWDAGDLCALAALTTEQLLSDLGEQLAARGPGPNRTEVLSLEARLLGIEELEDALVASVEFSGLIREQPGEHARHFRELWMLADLKLAGRGWRLARVQALG